MLILRFAPGAEKNCNQPFFDRKTYVLLHALCKAKIKRAVTFGKTEKVREQIKNLICVAKNANETVIC